MTVKEAVLNGVQLLDEKFPNWENKIDLNKFSIDICDKCILGQLFKYYWHGLLYLDIRFNDDKYGFNCYSDDEFNERHDYLIELENEWKKIILEKRQLNEN